MAAPRSYGFATGAEKAGCRGRCEGGSTCPRVSDPSAAAASTAALHTAQSTSADSTSAAPAASQRSSTAATAIGATSRLTEATGIVRRRGSWASRLRRSGSGGPSRASTRIPASCTSSFSTSSSSGSATSLTCCIHCENLRGREVSVSRTAGQPGRARRRLRGNIRTMGTCLACMLDPAVHGTGEYRLCRGLESCAVRTFSLDRASVAATAVESTWGATACRSPGSVHNGARSAWNSLDTVGPSHVRQDPVAPSCLTLMLPCMRRAVPARPRWIRDWAVWRCGVAVL